MKIKLPVFFADLRTDGVERVRIASGLSELQRSCKNETPRAWSKSKTADSRTDGVERVRIASGLSELQRSCKNEIPRAWSKSKTADLRTDSIAFRQLNNHKRKFSFALIVNGAV